MPRTTPVASAAAELLARRHAREDLIGFTTYTFPGFEVARHHSVIASKLEAIKRGEIDTVPVGKRFVVKANRKFERWQRSERHIKAGQAWRAKERTKTDN